MAKENIEGGFDKAVGKVKQKVGEATGDQALANRGVAEQVKGSAKQAVGSVKDTTKRIVKPRATSAKSKTAVAADDLRDDIVAGAEHVKNAIEHGLHRMEHPHDSRDIRQVH
jgi:uncharacterized protein YjbJ (UPF0337 family)